MRPGVTERLGLGPDVCHQLNPSLVYGRITGWGQQGPMANQVGHDINFISLTGMLHTIGRAGQTPVPPLNLVGDFGGGSMFLLVGVLSALWERERSGRGQVIDAAMVDGVSVLAQMTHAMRADGAWNDDRQSNLLDGGAPFYDTYVCSDGRHVAVGALEPQFYSSLLEGLGLSAAALPSQDDRAGWPLLREIFCEKFVRRTRDEWTAHFANTNACVTPVLSLAEATRNEHLSQRGTFVMHDDSPQPAPAPRFSRTAAAGAGAESRTLDGRAAVDRWSPAAIGRPVVSTGNH
jgi:alpha-methylacyl-CoA racemase